MSSSGDGETSFTDVVKSVFLSNARDLGFAIVGQQQSDRFGDALVILQSGDVRLRIVRDRLQLFADLGSAAETDNWFDSTIVMQALGLTTKPVFGGRDAQVVLPSIAAFLRAMWPELVAMFDRRNFAKSKEQLGKLEDARRGEMGIH